MPNDEAGRLRDEGMALAETAEAAVSPAFSEVAYQAIVDVARRQTTVHIDDVLVACKVRPFHPNAWGSVWTRAIRAGIIRYTGMRKGCLTDIKKRKHVYPVYESTIFQRGADNSDRP